MTSFLGFLAFRSLLAAAISHVRNRARRAATLCPDPQSGATSASQDAKGLHRLRDTLDQSSPPKWRPYCEPSFPFFAALFHANVEDFELFSRLYISTGIANHSEPEGIKPSPPWSSYMNEASQ